MSAQSTDWVQALPIMPAIPRVAGMTLSIHQDHVRPEWVGSLRQSSPLGRLELLAVGEELISLAFERDGVLPHDHWDESPSVFLHGVAEQLDEYFAGSRSVFRVPLRVFGTPFQRAVWDRLAALHRGETTSYGRLAGEIGRPRAVRAVGQAVAANPIPLIIGCHRVRGARGTLTGYSHGRGLETKLWLLEHEGVLLNAPAAPATAPALSAAEAGTTPI